MKELNNFASNGNMTECISCAYLKTPTGFYKMGVKAIGKLAISSTPLLRYIVHVAAFFFVLLGWKHKNTCSSSWWHIDEY